MHDWEGWIWRGLAFTLVTFFGGWFLSGFLTAILVVSPGLFSPVFCPSGTTASVGFVDALSQAGMTVACQDHAGQTVLTLTEAETYHLQHQVFFTASILIMALLAGGWLAFSSARRKNTRQPAQH
jgi:hypothetical protein